MGKTPEGPSNQPNNEQPQTILQKGPDGILIKTINFAAQPTTDRSITKKELNLLLEQVRTASRQIGRKRRR